MAIVIRPLVCISALLLSSCVQLDLRNKLGSASRAPSSPCDVRYSLEIASGWRTNTYGARKSEDKTLQKLKSRYVEFTKEALTRNGCAAVYVETGAEGNFKVGVDRMFSLSMSPQGWLTGLSLGLIPSWETRPRQIAYSFEDTRTGKSHTYYVDKTTYAHLVLLPFAIFADEEALELKVYEEALADFIGGS